MFVGMSSKGGVFGSSVVDAVVDAVNEVDSVVATLEMPVVATKGTDEEDGADEADKDNEDDDGRTEEVNKGDIEEDLTVTNVVGGLSTARLVARASDDVGTAAVDELTRPAAELVKGPLVPGKKVVASLTIACDRVMICGALATWPSVPLSTARNTALTSRLMPPAIPGSP